MLRVKNILKMYIEIFLVSTYTIEWVDFYPDVCSATFSNIATT